MQKKIVTSESFLRLVGVTRATKQDLSDGETASLVS